MTSLPLIHANQNCHELDEPIHDLIDDPHTDIESLGAYPNKRNVNKRLDYIIALIAKSTASRYKDQNLGDDERIESIGAKSIAQEEAKSFGSWQGF